MAQQTGPIPTRDRDGLAERDPVVVRGHRETRPGYETTEFLLTVVAALAAIIASYASRSGQGAFPIRWGWLVAIIVVSAYVISRGIAKAGVADRTAHDPRP